MHNDNVINFRRAAPESSSALRRRIELMTAAERHAAKVKSFAEREYDPYQAAMSRELGNYYAARRDAERRRAIEQARAIADSMLNRDTPRLVQTRAERPPMRLARAFGGFTVRGLRGILHRLNIV